MRLWGDALPSQVESHVQPWGEAHHPAVDLRMTQSTAALASHLFQVPKAKAVGQTPVYAQENDRSVDMAARELCDFTPSHT